MPPSRRQTPPPVPIKAEGVCVCAPPPPHLVHHPFCDETTSVCCASLLPCPRAVCGEGDACSRGSKFFVAPCVTARPPPRTEYSTVKLHYSRRMDVTASPTPSPPVPPETTTVVREVPTWAVVIIVVLSVIIIVVVLVIVTRTALSKGRLTLRRQPSAEEPEIVVGLPIVQSASSVDALGNAEAEAHAPAPALAAAAPAAGATDVEAEPPALMPPVAEAVASVMATPSRRPGLVKRANLADSRQRSSSSGRISCVHMDSPPVAAPSVASAEALAASAAQESSDAPPSECCPTTVVESSAASTATSTPSRGPSPSATAGAAPAELGACTTHAATPTAAPPPPTPSSLPLVATPTVADDACSEVARAVVPDAPVVSPVPVVAHPRAAAASLTLACGAPPGEHERRGGSGSDGSSFGSPRDATVPAPSLAPSSPLVAATSPRPDSPLKTPSAPTMLFRGMRAIQVVTSTEQALRRELDRRRSMRREREWGDIARCATWRDHDFDAAADHNWQDNVAVAATTPTPLTCSSAPRLAPEAANLTRQLSCFHPSRPDLFSPSTSRSASFSKATSYGGATP